MKKDVQVDISSRELHLVEVVVEDEENEKSE